MICPLVGRRLWATMRSMVAYTKAAVERAMQVQEVILRAMAKRITWWQAAEIIGISDRSMRRWRERYEQHGYDGLLDRRRGAPSGRRVPLAEVEQVLGLYRERYFDLNVRHFHEKLAEEHGVHLSYTLGSSEALQGAGLVARGCLCTPRNVIDGVCGCCLRRKLRRAEQPEGLSREPEEPTWIRSTLAPPGLHRVTRRYSALRWNRVFSLCSP